MNRVSSIFSQVLQLAPRHLFERAVRDHKGERHARGFTCWDQFVAMLFCQLAQSKSLREIGEGLRASEGNLKHLGLSGAPSHFTLAYDFISANERTDERVHADDLIQFRQHDKPGQERFFRRVVWWDAERKRSFEFLTNQLTLDAATIAAIYRERWQIELLFKALKQNLRIKTFVGASSNALHIQIWTALIALLLVRFLQLRSRVNRHLSRFLALLRQQLFVYRDLGRFLHDPFERPPRPPLDEPQLLLDWSGEHSVQNPQPASGIDRSETASPAESTRDLAEIS